MAHINPHVIFNGNAQEAINFYQSVFGGEVGKIIRFKDLASPEFPVPPNEENKLLNIALSFSTGTISANDVPEIMGKVNENENRSKIAVHAESREEADKIFNGLSEGGSVEMPISDSPWGTYFAMFRDKYGIEWTVEYSTQN